MGQESVSGGIDRGVRHSLVEDVLALLLGTLMVGLGLSLFAKATLVTGSLAGVALITSYLTDWSFGAIFFVINLPFYVLAFWRMGWRFGVKTVACVLLVSVFSTMIPHWLRIEYIHPLFAAAAGGGAMGLGMLSVFRHRASVGGINILAFLLQEHYGLRAGYFQLGVDVLVLAAAFFVLPWERVGISLVGAAIVNLIIALNHKPGRYVGFS